MMVAERTARLAYLCVPVAAVLAFVFLSLPWFTGCFGPMPPVMDAPTRRLPSGDGRWLASLYYVPVGRSSGDVDSLVLLERRDGRFVRVAYWGPAADLGWSGRDMLVVEQESGSRHRLAVPTGSYDARTDDVVNAAGTLVLMSLPVMIAAAAAWLAVRLLLRSLPMRRPRSRGD